MWSGKVLTIYHAAQASATVLKVEKMVDFNDSTLDTARKLLHELVRVTRRLAPGFKKGVLCWRCLTLALL